jgi:rubrerythrin
MIAGHRAHALLDKLAERLAFERAGTRLYEAFVTKCEANADALGPIALETLREFRDEEARHARLLDEAIRALGGDPTAETPCADLAGVESIGLLQVVTDPRTSVVQSLHSILVAELADEVAWDLLADSIRTMGQGELAQRFREALTEERVHLQTIRDWYDESTRLTLGIKTH